MRKIKPYTASRHAAGSYLAHAGVSADIIAAWLGHTDASFTMKTDVHARPEDLAAARDALAARKIAKGGVCKWCASGARSPESDDRIYN